VWNPFRRHVTEEAPRSRTNEDPDSTGSGPAPRSEPQPPPVEQPRSLASDPELGALIESLLEPLRLRQHAHEQRLSRVVQALKQQGLSVPGRWPQESSEDGAGSPQATSETSAERPRVVAGRRYRSSPEE